MTELKDGATVRSWLGDVGKVEYMKTCGERDPRPFVRFKGKLVHHPAWTVRPFIRQTAEVER